MMDKQCRHCWKPLEADEIKYYGDSCNECEAAWSDEINEWRHGGENEQQDRLFSVPKPIRH